MAAAGPAIGRRQGALADPYRCGRSDLDDRRRPVGRDAGLELGPAGDHVRRGQGATALRCRRGHPCAVLHLPHLVRRGRAWRAEGRCLRADLDRAADPAGRQLRFLSDPVDLHRRVSGFRRLFHHRRRAQEYRRPQDLEPRLSGRRHLRRGLAHLLSGNLHRDRHDAAWPGLRTCRDTHPFSLQEKPPPADGAANHHPAFRRRACADHVAGPFRHADAADRGCDRMGAGSLALRPHRNLAGAGAQLHADFFPCADWRGRGQPR